MSPVVWWVIAVLLIIAGVIGTFLPAVPGVVLVLAGMLLAAWTDDFRRIGSITLVILGSLTLLSLIGDVVGSVIGAKRVGASRSALLGAAIGSVVGMFYGLAGALIAPFFGAAAGELMTKRRLADAARVGVGTWVGIMLSLVARVLIVLAMLAVFVASLLL